MEEELKSLHEMLCRELTRRLAAGDMKASELNVVRQFLKDNNVDSLGHDNNLVEDMMKSLPDHFFDGKAN